MGGVQAFAGGGFKKLAREIFRYLLIGRKTLRWGADGGGGDGDDHDDDDGFLCILELPLHVWFAISSIKCGMPLTAEQVEMGVVTKPLIRAPRPTAVLRTEETTEKCNQTA